MAFINYLGIFLSCLCILQAASAQQQAESFNVYYHVDDVSCAGNDGAIRVDSFSCSVTGGGVGGNCYSGGIPASYSCQDSYDHLLSGTGQSATLQNGATYKIDGNYSGNIDFHGNATLYICGVATIDHFNVAYNSKVIVFGELITSQFNVNTSSAEIINYGKISVSSDFNAAGTIKSYGEIFCKSAVNLNANTTIENYGDLIIGNSPEFGGPPDNNGTIRLNSPNTRLDNHGLLEVYNSLIINSQSVQLRNYCTLKVRKNMDVNTSIPFENHGYVEALLASTWNSVAILFHPGSYYKTGSLSSNSASVSNPGTGCAKLEVASIQTFNSNTFSGDMSLCFPSYTGSSNVMQNGAVEDCLCSANGTSGGGGSGTVTSSNPSVFDIVWSGGGGTSRTLSGLSGGLYEATISNDLCQRTIKFQVRSNPKLAFEYSSERPSCAGKNDGFISISAFGGVPPYQYQFTEGGTWYTDRKLSDLPGGNYQLNVRDANSCTGVERNIVLAAGLVQEKDAVIDYVTCFADSNEARIILDGDVVTVLPDTLSQVDTSRADFSLYSCFGGISGIPYTCADGVVISSNSNYYIGSGNTATLNQDFSGWLDIGGGTLIICGDVTLSSLSLNNPNDKIIVLGTLHITGIYMNSIQSQVYNYGVIDYRNNYVSIAGKMYNYGTMSNISGMAVNASGHFENYGTLSNSSDLYVDNRFINYGPVTIGGMMGINSQGLMENHCTVAVAGKVSFTSNGQYVGYHTLTAGGELELNSIANVRLDNAILDVGFLRTSSHVTINEVEIEGFGPYCSQVRVRDGAYFNAYLSLNGKLSFCVDPGATLTYPERIIYQTPDAEPGCSCTRVTEGDLLVDNPGSGNGGGQYLVIDGTESDTVVVGQSGTYVITYQDKDGCMHRVTARVQFPEKPSVSVVAYDLSCSQVLNDGEIRLVYDRGEVVRAELYRIEEPGTNRLLGTGRTHKGMFAGDYRIAFHTPEGCVLYDSVSVSPSVADCHSDELDFDVRHFVQAVSCDSFKVVVFDESLYGIESYKWILPDQSVYITDYNELGVSAQGVYQLYLTVRGENGILYQVRKDLNIVIPAGLDFQYSVLHSLEDDHSGSITIHTVSGNSGNVTYSGPSRTENSPVFTGLKAGTYTVTVSDQFCTVSKEVEVETDEVVNPCGNLTYELKPQNISCYGANDGLATLVLVSTDAESIAGRWYAKESTGLLSLNDELVGQLRNLTPGQYEVTPVISKGGEQICEGETLKFDITQPEELLVQALKIQMPDYADSRNGEIYVSFIGGSNPVITWIGEDQSYQGRQQRTGLRQGVYSYKITDANQCSYEGQVTLTAGCQLLSAEDEENGCTQCNTQIETGVSGQCISGESRRKALCDNVSLCSTIGIGYDFSAYECTSNPGFVELQLNIPSELAGKVSILKAEWYQTGSCILEAEGPLLRDVGQSSYELYTELSVGSEVCIYDQHVMLPSADTALFVVSVSDLPCLDLSGNIFVQHRGDFGPYTYSWANPSGSRLTATGNRIEVTQAGEYTYTARSTSGCVYQHTVSVGLRSEACEVCEQTGLRVLSGNISCNGANDGHITLYHGPDFEISKLEWFSGGRYYANTRHLFGLSKGSYNLKADLVHKASGEVCHIDETYTISEPAPLQISASVLNLCHHTISDFVSGGTGGYTYIWKSVAGENAPELSCISDGNFQVTILDENICSLEAMLSVNSSDCEPENALCYTVSAVNTSCDNLGGKIHVSQLAGAAAYTITVRAVSGTYTASASVMGNSHVFSGVPSGNYLIDVEAIVEGIPVRLQKHILVPSYFPPDYTVFTEPAGETGCRIQVRAQALSPVYGNYEFEWKQVGQHALLSGIHSAILENGSYLLTVTDPFNPGCPQEIPVEVDGLEGCVSPDADFNIQEEITNCYNGDPVRAFSVGGSTHVVAAISWYFNGVLLNRIDPVGGITNIVSEDGRTLSTSATDGLLEVKIDYYHEYKVYSLTLEHLISANQRYVNTLISSGRLSCESESSVKLAVSSTIAPELLTYAWYKVSNPGGMFAPMVETSPEVSLSVGGDFAVVLSLPDGCSDTLYKSIKIIEKECACKSIQYQVNAGAMGCNDESGSLIFALDEEIYTIDSLAWLYGGQRVGTLASLTGLSDRGVYTLDAYVRSADGSCRINTDVLLESAGPIRLSNIQGIAPSCYGLTDGRISLQVNGGSGKYSFEDSNGNPLALSSLGSGTYTVVVKDRSNACQAVFTETIPEVSENCRGYGIVISGNLNVCYSESLTREEQMAGFKVTTLIKPLSLINDIAYWEWYDADSVLLKTVTGGSPNELVYSDLLASGLFTQTGPLYMELTIKAHLNNGIIIQRTIPIGSTTIPFIQLTQNDIIINNPTNGKSGYIRVNATEEDFVSYVYTIKYLGSDLLTNMTEKGPLFTGAVNGMYRITKSDGRCTSAIEVQVEGGVIGNNQVCEDEVAVNRQGTVITKADSDKEDSGAIANIVIEGSNLLGGNYFYRWNQEGDPLPLTSTVLQFSNLYAGDHIIQITHASRPECSATASFEVGERFIVSTNPQFTDECGMELYVYDYVGIDITEWLEEFGNPASFTDEQKRQSWIDYYDEHNVCRFYRVYDEAAGIYTVLDGNPSDDEDNYGERVSLVPGAYELVIGCNNDIDPLTETYEKAALPEDVWIEYIEEEEGLNLFSGRIACSSEKTPLDNNFWGESAYAGMVEWYYIDASYTGWTDIETHFDQFREGTVSASEITLLQAGWTKLSGDEWTNNRPLVSPAVTTVYGAIHTNGLCVSRHATAIRLIGGLTSTVVQKEICAGEEVTLDVAEAVSGSSYRFVRWEDIAGSQLSRTVSPVGAVFVRYRAEIEDLIGLNPVTEDDMEGCILPVDFDITILGSPIETGDETIQTCAGSTIRLQPVGGDTYAWDPSTGFDNLTVPAQELVAEEDQEYVVSITNESGCSVQKKYIIRVHEAFNPTLSVNTACLGDGRLQVDVSAGNSVSWSPQPVSVLSVHSAVFDLANAREMLVTAEVINENGCAVSIEKEVVAPGVLSLLSSQPKVCLGKPVQLFSNHNVTWTPALGLSSGASSNPYVYVTSSATYTASGKDLYGCPFSEKIVVEIDESCLCYQPNEHPDEETYFWRGGAGYTGDPVLFDGNWDNRNNWSVSKDSYVIPASLPDAADNVVLEDLSMYSGQFPHPVLSHDVALNNVCVLGHEWQLGSFNVRYTGNGVFSGGKVHESTGAIIGDGTTSADNIAYFSGTSFGSQVDIRSAEQLYLNGSEFLNRTGLEFTGTQIIYNAGGNQFRGNESRINHRGTADFYMAYTPDGKADQYAGQMLFEQNEGGKIFISSTYQDEYTGNVYLLGNNFVFGVNGGGVTMTGESEQYMESAGEQTAEVTMGHLAMNKPGFSAVNALVLNKVNICVQKGGSYAGKLELTNGYIKTNRENGLLTIENNVALEGGSQESFILGPLRIIRSGTVTFPVGKRTRYMPVTIQGLPAHTQGNIIEFTEDNPLRSDKYNKNLQTIALHDELKYLNKCEFWLADGQALKGAGVSVILHWDEQSCDIPYEPGNLRMAILENTQGSGSWLNAGNTLTTGSPKGKGSVQGLTIAGTATGNGIIAAYAYGAVSDPGYESPTGFSFNSYGAALTVKKGSSLIVYGNFLNEYSGQKEASVIDNQSVIKVEDDWTNNAFRAGTSSEDNIYVFSPYDECEDCEGSVFLFGNDQRIRGTQKTRFHKLHLTGFGTKTMYVDAEVDKQEDALLALEDNVLHTGMYNMTVLHTSPLTIARKKTGYVKSGVEYANGLIKGGLLVWHMDPEATYQFPIGSDQYYRPVDITSNETSAEEIIYGLRLVQDDPENHGLSRGPAYRSPFIERINHRYYYHISKLDETMPVLGVNLKLYFDRDKDGAFQSLAQWGKAHSLDSYLGVQLQPFSGTTIYDYTPGVTSIWNVADGGYSGQFADNLNTVTANNQPEDYIELTGHKTVNDPYYSLIRSGIIMQSAHFGDPDGDNSQITYKVGGESQTTGNGGVVGQTEHPGAIGDSDSEQLNHGNLLVPDQWAKVMDIQIEGNSNTAAGIIQIETDDNGRIAQDSEGTYRITWLDCSVQSNPCEKKILNPELYTVKGGSMLELRSTKNYVGCPEQWEVNWNYDATSGAFTEMVVNGTGQGPEQIDAVYLCPVGASSCSEGSGSFSMVPGSGTGVYVVPGGSGITEGVYILHIRLSGGGEIKGQIIYK
jgi:hypothetical protein